jgi:hypothetical protein
MRWAPKPTLNSVGHCTGSTATVALCGKRRLTASPAAIVPAEPMAETNAPTGRSRLAATSSAAAPVQWKWKR